MRDDHQNTYDNLKEELNQIKKYQINLPKLRMQFNDDIKLMRADLIDALYDFYVLDKEEAWETIEMLCKCFVQKATLIDSQRFLEQKINSQKDSLKTRVKNLKSHFPKRENLDLKYWTNEYERMLADMKDFTPTELFRKDYA
jgi:hypothetical protein